MLHAYHDLHRRNDEAQMKSLSREAWVNIIV
jgi:hypothetical protein